MEISKIIAVIAFIFIVLNTMGQQDTLHRKKMTPPDIIGTSPVQNNPDLKKDTTKSHQKKYKSPDSLLHKSMGRQPDK